MAINGAVTLDDLSPLLESQISQISLWIKGLGIVAVVWIVYSIVMFFINQKRAKDIEELKSGVERIENKINKLASKR
ncbi:MAG: hypothetical protein AABX93_00050 [Nanoarchaeota archaeon]